MKPHNFEQILEKFLHKTYEYENNIIHNHITTIKYENNILSFLCEGITFNKMNADPVFTIQKLDKEIEQAIDAVDEDFILFEHKNKSVDKIYEYCRNNDDQFTDIFKNPYKLNEDTYIFTSAMVMDITKCDSIVAIEYDNYSIIFAAYNIINTAATDGNLSTDTEKNCSAAATDGNLSTDTEKSSNTTTTDDANGYQADLSDND